MLKRYVKSALRKAGWEVTHYNSHTCQWAALSRMLAAHSVDLVLDVGANEGQYALALRDSGYTGQIVSFEPLPAAHARLTQAARRDPCWMVAERAALGAQEGTGTMNVAANDTISSLLPMLSSVRDAVPQSACVAQEPVPVVTLDGALQRLQPHMASGGSRKIFLKIDVQGYEAAVLEGARRLLQTRICGIEIELSLVPLYQGQALYPEIYESLSRAGFELWNLFPVFSDLRVGRLLQVDGVFFRNNVLTA